VPKAPKRKRVTKTRKPAPKSRSLYRHHRRRQMWTAIAIGAFIIVDVVLIMQLLQRF